MSEPLRISKEEEQRSLQHMRKFLIGNKPIGKYLRKVRHHIPSEKFGENSIEYLIRIVKNEKGDIYISNVMLVDSSYDKVFIPGTHYHKLPFSPLNENTSEPNLSISKQEEQWALQILRKRTNSIGEQIGKYLKKKCHIKSTDPKVSDKIVYLNTDDSYTYIIKKDKNGKVIYGVGFSEPGGEYESSLFDPIVENTSPTGNWTSWGSITSTEKEHLKLALQKYQEYVKNIYVQNISAPKIYLIQKTINNLEVTDPRFASKPLSKLNREDRLSLMDFVDQQDSTGLASRAMDFLMNISRKFIEPIRIPKPDIFLKGIARCESLYSKWAGNVEIFGLDDMRPRINIGYGSYNLDEKFIKDMSKTGSQLYIDIGTDIKVINMSEIMERVKQAIADYNKKNLTENLRDNTKGEVVVLARSDEQYVVQFIKDIIIQGERVGQTLKKEKILPPRKDHFGTKTSNVFHYQAIIKNKVYDYFFWKVDINNGFIVLIGENSDDYYIYKEFFGSENNILKENKENITTISKEEEQRAVQLIKRSTVNGILIGKTLQKISQYKSSVREYKKYKFQVDDITLVIDFSKDPNVKNALEIEVGVMNSYTIRRFWLLTRPFALKFKQQKLAGELQYYIGILGDIKKNLTEVEDITEPPTEPIILTKKDELRAVQFISNLTIGGIRFGKTLKKVKIIKTGIPTLSSDTSVYEAILHYTGRSIKFEIFRSWRRGLVIFDTFNQKIYNPDKNLTENSSIDNPNISKKEEQQAVQIMGNFKDKYGNRFGKNLKKFYSGSGSNGPVIKYESQTEEGPMVFQLLKAPDGSIVILSGMNSIMKVFKPT